ncbi:condensation domain-containing protein, partial [Desulfonatronospira sp.]|uniref:condensation domain-containing protein n=1 Tax=Desulfonatronospira sp. TaxID=1962951 RepID=UPI0025BC14D4
MKEDTKLHKLKINPENVEDVYSLSPLQQGMLFHTLRDKGVGMYISQSVSRYDNLDTEAFQRAWRLIIDRHTILRTSFHWDDPEKPVQVVHGNVDLPFTYQDWRVLPPSEQNSRLRKLQQEERENGFDLNRAPLIKFTVIQVSKTHWFCVNTHHHIILDGWSGALLAKEFRKAYEDLSRGGIPTFEPPIPFGRYIRWLESQDHEAVEDFWKKHIGSVSRPTPLPAERETGDKTRIRMHVESWGFRLDDHTAQRVDLFAKKCRVTLNTVIQSAWPLLLSRYSGTKSVIFGIVVSGRPPELNGVEKIVGMFLNTVPFRVTVEDNLSVRDWLQKIHTDRIELQRFEHSPLMLVQQWSCIPGGIPLFNSIVARKDVTQAAQASRRARG